MKRLYMLHRAGRVIDYTVMGDADAAIQTLRGTELVTIQTNTGPVQVRPADFSLFSTTPIPSR